MIFPEGREGVEGFPERKGRLEDDSPLFLGIENNNFRQSRFEDIRGLRIRWSSGPNSMMSLVGGERGYLAQVLDTLYRRREGRSDWEVVVP